MSSNFLIGFVTIRTLSYTTELLSKHTKLSTSNASLGYAWCTKREQFSNKVIATAIQRLHRVLMGDPTHFPHQLRDLFITMFLNKHNLLFCSFSIYSRKWLIQLMFLKSILVSVVLPNYKLLKKLTILSF